MPAFRDLTGQRFGRLMVIRRIPPPPSRFLRTFWECQCDCGKTIGVDASSLKSENTKSCGCYQCPDMTGLKFGRLTIIKRAITPLNGKSKRSYWVCHCECGKDVLRSGRYLRGGHIKSCGCYGKERHREYRIKSLVGQRFGKLVVIKLAQNGPPTPRRLNGPVRFECLCDCGKKVIRLGTSLRKGGAKDCGMRELHRVGAMSSSWRGGVGYHGYRMIYIEMPESVRENARRKNMLEHDVVMSKYIGRPLLKSETVHHKNGDRLDNRIENLELWSKSHPPGQRAGDKVKWAREIITLYGDIDVANRIDSDIGR